jgi:hypothetical protein
MVGQSIVFEAASGDEIRLYNFGGEIFEDSARSECYTKQINPLFVTRF